MVNLDVHIVKTFASQLKSDFPNHSCIIVNQRNRAVECYWLGCILIFHDRRKI